MSADGNFRYPTLREALCPSRDRPRPLRFARPALAHPTPALSMLHFAVENGEQGDTTTATAYAAEFTAGGVFTGTAFNLGTVSTTSSSMSGNVDASELPNGNIAFTWVSSTGAVNR